MAIPVLMPALSPTMKEGNLSKWLKKEGDKIKPGEVIAEIETDKATMEVESADSGILGKLVVPEKTSNVKVNELIAVILESGEKTKDAEKFAESYQSESTSEQTQEKATANAPTPPAPAPKTTISTPSPQPQTVEPTNSRVFASPLARRIAANESLELKNIQGSGPRGRIVKSDVEHALSGNHAPAMNFTTNVGRNSVESELRPVSVMRQVIAERLTESKQNVPHFYLSLDCELDELTYTRALINEAAPKNGDKAAYKISVNDFVIKACACALRDNPEANSSWTDQGIVQYNNVDISVAVAIQDGLITPIIQNADQKSLAHISSEMKSLANKAKTGTLAPEEFQGGSFTISNLGMFGIKSFSAIINPPQACIISVGAAEQRPIMHDDGEFDMATFMNLTISCDHRVVDGAVGAKLLNSIKNYLETPSLMLV